MNEELLYNQLYDKTKDCGRTQFVKLLMDKERENKELKEEIYKSNAVADTNIELAEKYYKENQKLKEQLQQKEDIINKIKKCIEEKEEYYGDYMGDGNYTMYSMMGANNNRIPYIKSNLIKQILDNKGE